VQVEGGFIVDNATKVMVATNYPDYKTGRNTKVVIYQIANCTNVYPEQKKNC
jgi:hypothetical protein